MLAVITFLAFVAVIILALLAPFIGLGVFFETPAGQGAYDSINWVLSGGPITILIGFIIWLFALMIIIVIPCGFLFSGSVDDKNDDKDYGSVLIALTFFIIGLIPITLGCLLARWAMPFGWSLKVTMWITVIGVVILSLAAMGNLPGEPKTEKKEVDSTAPKVASSQGNTSNNVSSVSSSDKPSTPNFTAD